MLKGRSQTGPWAGGALSSLVLLVACTAHQPAVEDRDQADTGAARAGALEIHSNGVHYLVTAEARDQDGGFIVEVEVEVASGDGRTYRLADLPLRLAARALRRDKNNVEVGWGSCSGPASHGGVFDEVTPGKRITLRIRLAPSTSPAYHAGSHLRAGLGLWEIQDPDGARHQPAIATIELDVRAPAAPRLKLRPGVDADLQRDCKWTASVTVPT